MGCSTQCPSMPATLWGALYHPNPRGLATTPFLGMGETKGPGGRGACWVGLVPPPEGLELLCTWASTPAGEGLAHAKAQAGRECVLSRTPYLAAKCSQSSSGMLGPGMAGKDYPGFPGLQEVGRASECPQP